MRVRLLSLLGLVALVLAGLLPASTMATNRQIDTDSYRSPQFGYLVTWNDDWAARERDSSSTPGAQDILVLSTNAGRLQVIGEQTDASPADLLLDTMEDVTAGASEVEIMANDPAADVPTTVVQADNTVYAIELHDLDGIVVSVILSARDTRFDTALDLAGQVALNDSPLFSGEPAGDTEDLPATRVPEQTTGIGIDGTTFTSSYGFAVAWDDDWTATEFLDAEYEFLNLTGPTGSIIVVGSNLYDGDAEACLEGEDAYYATEDPDLQDWEIALDDNGDEIFQTSDTFASGVFTYTYAAGVDTELVDYIECRTLEEGESTMIIVVTGAQDEFADHLEVALPITNGIEMPAGAELAEESDPALPDVSATSRNDDPDEDPQTPTPDPDDEDTPDDSGLDGTTFTSPGFGFTLDVPDGWEVQAEDIAPGDESIVLFNGTSLITVRGSDTLPLDPVDCVAAVRAEAEELPQYADLTMDVTASGDLFQGADDRGAYALFTYIGADDEEWTYFVRCEPLVEDESVLAIVQDVPSDDYVSERQARRLIQISIDRP